MKRKRISQKERYARMIERGAKDYRKKIDAAFKAGIISPYKAIIDGEWVKAYYAAARAIRDGGF